MGYNVYFSSISWNGHSCPCFLKSWAYTNTSHVSCDFRNANYKIVRNARKEGHYHSSRDRNLHVRQGNAFHSSLLMRYSNYLIPFCQADNVFYSVWYSSRTVWYWNVWRIRACHYTSLGSRICPSSCSMSIVWNTTVYSCVLNFLCDDTLITVTVTNSSSHGNGIWNR